MVKCSLKWPYFNGEIAESLLLFFIFYCCAIFIAGSICNALALWCVVRCPRTAPPIKVILCALFSSTLIICLFGMPLIANVSLAKLWCDKGISEHHVRATIFTVYGMTQMELCCISVMAVLRARAVWVPRRGSVTLSTAIAVVVATGLHASLVAALKAAFWRESISRSRHYHTKIGMTVVTFVLPVLLTLACYLSTIVGVRRNKLRLATSQQAVAVTQVMDQATRAMLAVFLSNLLFGLPHAIAHLEPFDDRIFSYIIAHSFFFTHLLVDPLVFLCFNQHHRRRVLHTLQLWISNSRQVVSIVIEQVTQSSSDPHNSVEGHGKAGGSEGEEGEAVEERREGRRGEED